MKWIETTKKLPRKNQIVDVFVNGNRWTDYIYTRNYGGTKGNDFFEPTKGGVSCIRDASHWMYPPKPPKQ